jgi:hypothetical protein
MGTKFSKSINDADNYTKMDENDCLMEVKFIQLKTTEKCKVSPDQLNLLLGSKIPRYSIVDRTEYSYLYCVKDMSLASKIINENGYEIGFNAKQKIYKTEFNEGYKTGFDSNFNYKLYKN